MSDWISYNKLGVGELLLDILEEADKSDLLDDDDKELIGQHVMEMAQSRQDNIARMEVFRQKYIDSQLVDQQLRKQMMTRLKYGVILPSDEVRSSKMVAARAKEAKIYKEMSSADQNLVGRIHHLALSVKEVYAGARGRRIKTNPTEVYGDMNESLLQEMILDELVHAAAASESSSHGAAVSHAISYVADLPNMIYMNGRAHEVPKDDARALYEAFREYAGGQLLLLPDVDDFMKRYRSGERRRRKRHRLGDIRLGEALIISFLLALAAPRNR